MAHLKKKVVPTATRTQRILKILGDFKHGNALRLFFFKYLDLFILLC